MECKPLRDFRMTGAATRLIIVSNDLSMVAGEYELLRILAHEKPAYKRHSTGSATYLIWSPTHSTWIFTDGFATENVGVAEAAKQTPTLIARSFRIALTTLPDELLSPYWFTADGSSQISVIGL